MTLRKFLGILMVALFATAVFGLVAWKVGMLIAAAIFGASIAAAAWVVLGVKLMVD